jgi:hypothetical protein
LAKKANAASRMSTLRHQLLANRSSGATLNGVLNRCPDSLPTWFLRSRLPLKGLIQPFQQPERVRNGN